MKINIFGSTGVIGTKSLELLNKHYPKCKLNLLVANESHLILLKQANKYLPNFICLKNNKKLQYIKNKLNSKVKIIYYEDLNNYLKNSKTTATILAISGSNAIFFLESIFLNTINLGLVNKECIVSCGHLFKKLLNKYKTNIFPLDSEHFSIFNSITNNNKLQNINKVFLTASGGPFLNTSLFTLKNVTVSDVIKHPKWKMGIKNSIDSATLANKCLELIEAIYLFNLSIDELDIVIHPEALIHSIIEYKNYTSIFNYFYNDMSIPISNFYKCFNNNNFDINKLFNFKKIQQLNFDKIIIKKYPIYKIFKNLNFSRPQELIKFNLANEYAVELFVKNKINYLDIPKIIEKSLSFDFNASINSIGGIITYEKEFNLIMQNRNENI